MAVAPYAGASFGTFDDELVPIGGLLIRWFDRFSTTSLHDGDNLHHMATWAFDRGFTANAMAVDQHGKYYFGLAVSGGF